MVGRNLARMLQVANGLTNDEFLWISTAISLRMGIKHRNDKARNSKLVEALRLEQLAHDIYVSSGYIREGF